MGLLSDATGFYRLLPTYYKINPKFITFDEKNPSKYIIQWNTFYKEWQLMKINFAGPFPHMEVEQLFTLSDRDDFLYQTNTDIQACETMHSIKQNNTKLVEKMNEMKEENNFLKKRTLYLEQENKRSIENENS